MEWDVENEAERHATGQEAVVQVKPKVSSVPATLSESYYRPAGTSTPGILLTTVLAWIALRILCRGRTLRSCALFLSLSCMLLLLAFVGMLWGVQEETNGMALYPSQLSDFCGMLFLVIRAHLWMVGITVVSIPLGIYWVILAYVTRTKIPLRHD